jgi:TPR repeat protein
MRRNTLHLRMARIAFGISLGILGLALASFAQESKNCPMEKVVLVEGKVAVCREATLQIHAQTNEAYQQNLIGKYGTLAGARKAFEKSALQGNPAAQANLGVMNAYGWGGAVNYSSAIYWLEEAANQGEPHALANLGTLYMNGWGVNQDYREALRLLTEAAEKGETAAMDNLGYLNDQGLGTEKNPQLGATWYAKAAEQGDAMGQNNLADMYLRGEGVRQDDKMAFDLFQKAAVQGNTGARIKLGYMYLNGRGTRQDLEAAYSWIQAASLAGDQRGQKYLVWLQRKLLQEQIQRAENRAKQMHLATDSAAVETQLALAL